MLTRPTIPGLFITGTDTEVGKTVVAAAIAASVVRRRKRVGVCKPIASGAVKRREGWVSEDAELLAHHAKTPFPLEIVCPQRFVEPLAPAIAAQRAKEHVDWPAIDRALKTICAGSDFLIVEGVGGIMVPLDRQHTVLDMAQWLNLPAVIVARPGLGTINHTLMTAAVLRQANVPVAGVIINQYPSETPTIPEETNPRAIEQWGKLRVLCLAPRFAALPNPDLPEDFLAAIDSVDWIAQSGIDG
jgi:dethiobiotin synthetase